MGTHPIFESDFDCLTENMTDEESDTKVEVPVGWKPDEFKPEHNVNGVLEESKFMTLFPKYREAYLKEIWPLVQKFLEPYKIKAELDLAAGSMTVKSTKQMWDPYAIINARDLTKLMSRSVPYEQAVKCFDDENAVEIIKIKGIVRNRDKFVKRRNRLVGPDGQTLKCLEFLTDCTLCVQGSTACCIGPHRGMKEARKVIMDTMNNKHPAHSIRELMIKRECAKNPELRNESWDKFMPQYATKNVKKKKFEHKEKKPYSPFPPPQQPSKIDLQLDSGEYFIKEQEKRKKKKQDKNEKQEAAEHERKKRRLDVLKAPKEKTHVEKDTEEPEAKKKKKKKTLSVDLEKLKNRQ